MIIGKIRLLLSGTLRRQLIWGVALVHALMMSLFIWDLTARQQTMLLEQQAGFAVSLANSISTSSAAWVSSHDLAGLQEVIEAQRSHPELKFAIIADSRGVILAHTDRQYMGKYLLQLPQRIEPQVLARSSDLVDVMNPVMMAGRHVGWIRVGISDAATHTQADRIIFEGILYALAAIVIGALLAAMLAARLTRRLNRIQEVADAVQAGMTDKRVQIFGADEASRLGQQFNGMLDALSAREREILQSRDALQLTQFSIDHSNEGVFWLDKEGKVVMVNERACNSLGYTRDELTGMQMWNFDPNFMASDWPPFFSRLKAAGAIEIESMHCRKDGVPFPVEVNANYVSYGEHEYSFALVRDISERRKLDENLVKLSLAVEQSDNSVVITNLDANIEYANQAFSKVSGYKLDEVIGKNPSLLHSGKNSKSTYEELWGCLTRGETWSGELINMRKDGSEYTESAHISPVRQPDGRVTHYLAIKEDITEKKRTEAALKESEEKFRRIFEDAADPVLLLRNGKFIDCNAATLSLLGYASKEKFLNLSRIEISPPYQPDGRTSAEKSAEIDAKAMQDGFHQFEWLFCRADGSTVPVEVTITPIMMGGERILHVTWRDITARQQAELAITRLNQTYRLLSQVNETIVRVQDSKELYTSICNAAVESGLFKLAWVGLLDKTEPVVVPAARAGADDGYTGKLNIRLDDERTGNGPTGRAMRSGELYICQNIATDPIMMPWRDEALKRGYCASAVFPIKEAGAVTGAINVYAEVSDYFSGDIIQLMLELAADVSFALDVFAEKKRRENAEEEIKQLNADLERRVNERTKQLEELNSELESFSYSVSHDLRAPLRSIDGFSHILLKNYHERLDAPGKDYLERVRRASQHMGHLIDDLLQLSKVTRGTLKREQIDLSNMAQEVADDLRKEDNARTVHFSIRQGMTIYADRGLLRIVISNLLGNAHKYSGKKEVAEIEFGEKKINGEHTFYVRDNGDGFNMDYAHKLFGAFQRLHSANEFEGTGIGLATVQRIIHRHHGKVWAEAKEGLGATFYFTLPKIEGEV